VLFDKALLKTSTRCLQELLEPQRTPTSTCPLALGLQRVTITWAHVAALLVRSGSLDELATHVDHVAVALQRAEQIDQRPI
jgi:hypothetical protein